MIWVDTVEIGLESAKTQCLITSLVRSWFPKAVGQSWLGLEGIGVALEWRALLLGLMTVLKCVEVIIE